MLCNHFSNEGTSLAMKTLILLIILSVSITTFTQDQWVAPESAGQVQNPVPSDAASLKGGEKIFQSVCWTCHGVSGLGDGPASAALTPKAGNLTSEIFHSQTDGAIFWKISEGRGMMSSYKGSLTTKQRWQLVNYVRTLKQSNEKIGR